MNADVQQTVDVVTITNRELAASQWVGPPRHGDRIKYSDGRISLVQGRSQVYNFDNTGDLVYVFHVFGG